MQVPLGYGGRSIIFMSTLQRRIDEYLRDKTPRKDVEETKPDSPEQLHSSEEIEMRISRESPAEKKQHPARQSSRS